MSTTPAPTVTPAPAHAHHAPPPAAQAAVLVVLLTLVLATVFVAFALPAVKSAPHDVPVGVAGPDAAVTQVEATLDAAQPGAFAVTAYPDAVALRDAILDRDVYGGLVLAPAPTMLTASGGSPVIAQMLTSAAGALGAQQSVTVPVEDVVPLPAADPRGAGLAAAALPITIGGLIPAIALVRRFPGRVWLRVAAASAFAVTAGCTLAAILQFWFGSTTGNYWGVALGLALGTAAIALTLLGLESVAGLPGFGVGAAVILLIGNPLSGIATAPELLPVPWGAIGQLLPPGANGTLLRSTAYFDGAGGGTAATVLTCWVALGLVLCAVAAFRSSRRPPLPA